MHPPCHPSSHDGLGEVLGPRALWRQRALEPLDARLLEGRHAVHDVVLPLRVRQGTELGDVGAVARQHGDARVVRPGQRCLAALLFTRVAEGVRGDLEGRHGAVCARRLSAPSSPSSFPRPHLHVCEDPPRRRVCARDGPRVEPLHAPELVPARVDDPRAARRLAAAVCGRNEERGARFRVPLRSQERRDSLPFMHSCM